MRLLIVDDSSTMRRILVATLTKLGYNDLIETSSGRDALQQLGNGGIDLVITDWNMPEMSGLDFVRLVRSGRGTRQIPVIMVTTNAAKTDIIEALKAGVDSYVVTPFTSDTIREKIEAVLRRAALDDPADP